MSAPILYRWSGDGFDPLPRFRRQCDEEFVIGEVYRMEEVQERSEASHNHEFAWLREAWANLPERYHSEFPTSEHLRKRALIDAGYYNQMSVDAGTHAAAIRVAAGFRAHDEYVVCVIQGPIVLVRSAQSQSKKKMGAKAFQESKTAILEIISNMLGVTPETLTKRGVAA